MAWKRPLVLAVAVVAVLALAFAGPATAMHHRGKKLKLKPRVYDPTASGIVVSQWTTKTGLPDAGKSDHAVKMQKNGPTATDAAAVGLVQGDTGLALTALGFSYRSDGHCGAGAPRYNVTLASGPLFFFGCSSGDVVGTEVDSRGMTWNVVRFTDADAFPQDGVSVWPGFATAPVVSDITVVFDEGNDTPLLTGTPGSVHLDNFLINDHLIKKPGAGGPKT